MGGKTTKTKEVLLNILKCLIIFYALYYGVSSIWFAIYRLNTFDGRIPFNFKTWIDLSRCCTGFTAQEMVHLLSMEVTLLLTGVLYGFVTSRWVWDYAITTIIIHISISCIVMLDFPMSWSWWTCLGCGMLLQILFGETLAYIRRRKRKAKVDQSPEQEPSNFLYRKL